MHKALGSYLFYYNYKKEEPQLRGLRVEALDCQQVTKKMPLKRENKSYKKKSLNYASACRGSRLVPVAGLEPARYRYRWILSPLRLPIPSHRQNKLTYALYNKGIAKSSLFYLKFKKSHQIEIFLRTYT